MTWEGYEDELEKHVSNANEEMPATEKQASYIRYLTYGGLTRKQASRAIEVLLGGE